jgi:hypothetical protein
MPIHEIQIKEYECAKCGYKWLNRINGKNGPIPERCAKCKRLNWNDLSEDITPKENGLRRRINGFRDLYEGDTLHYRLTDRKWSIDWPYDLSEKFLNMKPKPTIKELQRVIYSSPVGRYNNGSSVYKSRNKIPDPDNPGYLKYDYSHWVSDPDNPRKLKYNYSSGPSEYQKLLEQEAKKRQDIMIQIMKSRGVTYSKDDLADGIAKTLQIRKAMDDRAEEQFRPHIQCNRLFSFRENLSDAPLGSSS